MIDAIIIPFVAYHLQRNPDLNEYPAGIGVESSSYVGMVFNDSHRNNALFFGKRLAINDHVGFTVFGLSYKFKDGRKLIPGVLPVLSFGGKVRFEATVIPKLEQTKGSIIFAWTRIEI